MQENQKFQFIIQTQMLIVVNLSLENKALFLISNSPVVAPVEPNVDLSNFYYLHYLLNSQEKKIEFKTRKL